jgi:hypothetical protein
MDRIDEYLVRTLSAVLVQHLSSNDPQLTAIKQVLELLRTLRKQFPKGAFVGEAITRLETRQADYRQRLLQVEHLVRISYAFFYSPKVAGLMSRVAPASRSTKGDVPRVFQKDRLVDNPLKFIYEQSRSTTMTNEPDFKKSAWMMAQLAFSQVSNDS